MKHVPMLDLRLEYDFMKKDIDAAIKRCLEHQKWIQGPEVKEFETKVAEYLCVRYCIGVSSGTEALVLSLRALAIKTKGQEYFDRSDEIITTPFTFVATGDAILRAGATPVFVDIEPLSFNVDTEQIRQYLTSGNKGNVVGIVPVHLYGKACQMDGIKTIGKEHDLFIVEDVAQAFGGRWKETKLGVIGNTGCFSFFPSKNLGGFGDGGMVSTGDKEIADLIQMLLKHGGKDKYNVDHIGYNARLDTLQAAVLLAKMRHIEELSKRRVTIAESYNNNLQGVGGLTLPIITKGHVFNQYTIRVAGDRRDALQEHLAIKGISTMVYYPLPLHLMKLFDGGRGKTYGTLAHATRAAEEVLSLPIEPLMGNGEVERVIEGLKTFAV
jgi:dTDP-4-amino-4,6-dideoxygalactose transaminase